MKYEIVIIGGGPAGLAAAVSAREAGVKNILILERDRELGGILNQCIHNGFGLHTFQEELTGPEYAARYIEQIKSLNIEYKLNTMVLDIAKCEEEKSCSVVKKEVTAMNKKEGLFTITADAVILAMGCRERARGSLNIPGYRPAGVYSAGTAQRLVNMEGFMPGKEVVILGSGDIGLIMARRMTLEGAKVKLVAELMPYSGGLKRNIVQCLDDFSIPLLLSHTVVEIHGKDRLTGITLAKVDEQRNEIAGTRKFVSCDTLLLSVGLIPENELAEKIGVSLDLVTKGAVVSESLETTVPGVFACGNVLHVHDLVDYVSEEASLAGKNAAAYLFGTLGTGKKIRLKAGAGVRYTIPSYLQVENMQETLTVRFRVGDVFQNAGICVSYNGTLAARRKKRILAPGEMEEVVLQREELLLQKEIDEIEIKIEEGEKV